MKLLQILRSEPDALVARLARDLAEGHDHETVALYDDDLDYDRLLELVLASDRIICWW